MRGPDGRPWHSWRVLLLPYVEHEHVFKQYRFDEPWDGPHNRELAGRMPTLYRSHSRGREDRDPTTNYLAVVGPDTLWPGAEPRQVRGVSGDTILLVENHGAGVHWMEPRDLVLADMDLTVDSPAGVSSPYRGPAVVTLDDSVQRLDSGLPPATLRALLTLTGERPVRRPGGGWEPLADGRLRDRKP